VGLRKVDLCVIADHYGLFVPEKTLNPELLVIVREGFVRKCIFLLKDEEREASGEETAEEAIVCTLFTLSRFNPLCSASCCSDGTARLKVRLAHLEMGQKGEEHVRQMEFDLENGNRSRKGGEDPTTGARRWLAPVVQDGRASSDSGGPSTSPDDPGSAFSCPCFLGHLGNFTLRPDLLS
jgi:hypothetical protein